MTENIGTDNDDDTNIIDDNSDINNTKKDYKNRNCKHGIRESYCRSCNGSQICDHDKRKSICKDCKGNDICDHNKIKNQCKECCIDKLCKHKRLQCKECSTGKKCKHNEYISACTECKKTKICKHNKRKALCIDCGGSEMCQHGKRRRRCKDCNGHEICKHNKYKINCHICDIDIHPDNWCKLCKFVNVAQSPYNPYCFVCYCVVNPDIEIPRQYKLKEHHLRDSLKELYPNIKMVFDKKVDDGCSLRRPDVRIECLTHTIIIECDENKHQGYSCENKRIMEIFQDLGNRPIVFLRFNPDSYKNINTKKIIPSCFEKTQQRRNSLNKREWDRRIKLLNDRIKYYLNNCPPKEVMVEHLFYE